MSMCKIPKPSPAPGAGDGFGNTLWQHVVDSKSHGIYFNKI